MESLPVETLMHMIAATIPTLPGMMRTLMSWASKMGPKAGTSAKASGPNKLLLTNLRTANVQEESVCAKDPSDVRFGVAV
jgi:hypothetical protein